MFVTFESMSCKTCPPFFEYQVHRLPTRSHLVNDKPRIAYLITIPVCRLHDFMKSCFSVTLLISLHVSSMLIFVFLVLFPKNKLQISCIESTHEMPCRTHDTSTRTDQFGGILAYKCNHTSFLSSSCCYIVGLVIMFTLSD